MPGVFFEGLTSSGGHPILHKDDRNVSRGARGVRLRGRPKGCRPAEPDLDNASGGIDHSENDSRPFGVGFFLGEGSDVF